MGLDFCLTQIQPDCVEEPLEVYWGNYTHNVASMWDLAGIFDDLYKSVEKNAIDIVENLKKGYRKMVEKPAEFKRLNPSNGWGRYESALEFLAEVIRACEEYPDSIISR